MKGSSLKVLARIQHHPSRAELLPPLLELLAPLPTEVICDDGPPPPNPWRGYQLCLSGLPKCSHVLVLQDDAIPCVNFNAAILEIAKANPTTPVVLFLGGLPKVTGNNALKALKRGQHYSPVWIRDFVPVVALLWPKEKAEAFMAWSKTHKLPGAVPRSDDAVVGRWMIRERQRILVTIPSLVQHPDNVPSLIGRRAKWGKDRGRVALQFIEGDPLEIDWSQGAEVASAPPQRA